MHSSEDIYSRIVIAKNAVFGLNFHQIIPFKGMISNAHISIDRAKKIHSSSASDGMGPAGAIGSFTSVNSWFVVGLDEEENILSRLVTEIITQGIRSGHIFKRKFSYAPFAPHVLESFAKEYAESALRF